MLNYGRNILLFIIIVFYSFVSLNNVFAQDTNHIGVKVSPAILKYNVIQGEKIKSHIKFELINISNPNIEIQFLEAQSYSEEYQPSELFKSITKIQQRLDTQSFEINIDTDILIDKTYFFKISFFLNNIKGNTGQKENLNVAIPVILTVDKNKESKNPIPQYTLELNRKFVFSGEALQINFTEKNNSSKMIYSGGEIILLTEDNTVLYSEGVSPEQVILLPGASHIKIISPPQLLSQYTESLPYIGKVKVYYRGTINNERHIKTPFKEVYVIPIQYIIFGLALLISSISFIFWILKKAQN